MSENARNDEQIHPDELIVDARHRSVVEATLTGDLRVWSPADGAAEESADLQLVLLRGLRLSEYAPAARLAYAKDIMALTVPGRDFTDLDVLLYDLRRRFELHHGFVPVLGKNRDAIIGFPQHKSDADPVPVTGRVHLPPGEAGQGVHVGIVDTPFAPHGLLPDVDHDVAVGTDRPVPFWAGHSTFVAGLVRQQAPGARITARAGLDIDDGMSSAWRVAKAIASFRGSGIDVLNLSLGCVTADGAAPMVLRRALDRLDPEVLVVAAAGNRADQKNPPEQIWPAASSGVIAVGATDSAGEVAGFSMNQPWVDTKTLGVGVASTYLSGDVTLQDGAVEGFAGEATWNGTSFAAASITGALAAALTGHHVSPAAARTTVLAAGAAPAPHPVG